MLILICVSKKQKQISSFNRKISMKKDNISDYDCNLLNQNDDKTDQTTSPFSKEKKITGIKWSM